MTTDPDPNHVVWVPVDPPLDVWVLGGSAVFQTPQDVMPGTLPLWLHREGFNLKGVAGGEGLGKHRSRLVGQLRSRNGGWMALVEFEVSTVDGEHTVALRHLCPALRVHRVEEPYWQHARRTIV